MNDLKMLPMTFKFFTNKDCSQKIYLLQLETYQTYQFQSTGQNMRKMLKKGHSGGCLGSSYTG